MTPRQESYRRWVESDPVHARKLWREAKDRQMERGSKDALVLAALESMDDSDSLFFDLGVVEILMRGVNVVRK